MLRFLVLWPFLTFYRHTMSNSESYSPVQTHIGIVRDPYLPPLMERVGNQHIKPFAQFESTERVTYQSNETCQLGCSGCFLGDWLEGDRKGGKNLRVPLDLYQQHLDAMPGLKEFFLLGAEPTMAPSHSKTLLEQARGRGMSIMAVTNAAVGEEVFDRTFGGFSPDELSKLNISIDSMNSETHDMLRGREGALEKTLANVKRYVDMGYEVKAQMTVWPDNYAEVLESIQQLYEEYGVRKFAFHCGSVEGIAPDNKSRVRHLDPLAWRALTARLVELRDKLPELEEFNFPYIFFTEQEMRTMVIGDEVQWKEYVHHVEGVEAGEIVPMPFVGCPAAGQENGKPPQVYVYANDGHGQMSVCQIHSAGHEGMHHAEYDPQSEQFKVNRSLLTSQMLSIKESPNFCPAKQGAMGDGQVSDRIQTEVGDLYHGCRYLSINQMPWTESSFTRDMYEQYAQQYRSQ